METQPMTKEELAIFERFPYNYICRRDGTMVANPYQHIKVDSRVENLRSASDRFISNGS